MKRCLAILLVAVLLIGLMPLTGALAATEYATVVGGWLRLREKASFNATTISSYKTGTTVKVLSISNGWYRVETPDGRTGYMYGQYKKIVDRFEGGVITGKGLTFGGSLARTQATGYGVCYFSAEALKHLRNTGYEGKTVIVSGSGNVAQYCAEKVTALGGKVVAMSDSQGYIYDPNGINLRVLFDIKQRRRARISVYAQEVPGSEYHEGCKNIWNVKCDIAHPCASQNEMDAAGAQALVDNGAMAVFEGANMPLTPEAIETVQKNGLLYSPGKASNAGGLEMSQNSIRMSWSFEEVDEKLHGIMQNIYKACYDASVECGRAGDLMVGANVAGFLKVAEAMMAQGIV